MPFEDISVSYRLRDLYQGLLYFHHSRMKDINQSNV